MRNLILTIALLASTAALAQGIQGSRHDFRTGQTYSAYVNSADGEICKFCHTPHHALTTRALWNHTLSTAAYTWVDVSATIKGTPLPTGVTGSGPGAFQQGQSSPMCLSCHDGTVAIGDVANAGNGVVGPILMGGTDQTGGFLNIGPPAAMGLIGNGTGGLQGNHPVGIPFAGQTNYFGRNSGAVVADYKTNTAGVVSGGAQSINLYPDTTNSTFGVECSTCHDPHNATLNDHFLKAPIAGSAICLDCHNK